MTASRWTVRVLGATLAVASVGLAGWYSPFITAAGWHLFHPRGRVEYRGLRVSVPWPWTADSGADAAENPDGLSLKRMPFTMDRRLTNQSIFITIMSPDTGVPAGEQTDAWMGSFRATHPGATFDIRTPVAIPAGATCLSARSHWNEKGVVWTCISLEGGWMADFEGQNSDVPIFFRIVSKLR